MSLKHDHSLVDYRSSWVPTETAASRAQYLEALRSSDYTLCPPGSNVESYRIYEAMSMGSVPIIRGSVTIDDRTMQGAKKCFDNQIRIHVLHLYCRIRL